jgi:hypothetical protein
MILSSRKWQRGILMGLHGCCFEGYRYRNPMFPVSIGSTVQPWDEAKAPQ